MNARHGAAAEGAAAFAGPQLGVDPALVEELADDRTGPRTERLIAFMNDPAGGRPIAGGLVREEWGVAVVVVERLDAEQSALEAVVAVDRLLVPLRGGHQRFDDFLRDLVGQMPRRHRAG